MDRHHRCHLEDGENLIAGCPGLERCADMPPRTFRIEIRAGGVERYADQFDEFPWQDPVNPRIDCHLHARRSPGRVPFDELGPGRVPRTHLARRG